MTRIPAKSATTGAILWAILSTSSPLLATGAGAIPELRRFPDPLTLPPPPPQALEAVRVPDAPGTPAEKIVPGLWQRISALDPAEEIAIIVELHQPTHVLAATPLSPEWDAEQQELTTMMAHRFSAKAGQLLQNARGLSHFPLVFGTASREGIQQLAALPEVYRVYEDEIVYAMRAEGGTLIKANTLRTAYGGTGSGIGVAVLDTGIDITHPELASRVVAGGDFTGTTGTGGVDDNGHGTACAGIIAGTSGGMAPQASLWALKVLKANGQGLTSEILTGLNSAYANRNNFGGLDIVNMSLGSRGPYNSDCDAVSPYNTVLNSLYSAAIHVFVASGNYGDTSGISDPACHSKVVAVGAVYDANIGSFTWPLPPTCTDSSTAADKIACYSDSGNPLDILAPSHNATTTVPGGAYSNFGGTSAAAPYAAGVAAQILSLSPSTTPAQLRNAMMTTGKPITDVNGITRNRIDAVQAYQALAGTGGGDTSPCVRNSETACLSGGGPWANRIEVKVTYSSTTGGSGAADILYFGDQRGESAESSFWWFFVPTNFEMGVKIIDACTFTGNYWVYISGLTNVAYTVRLRDTQTGNTRTYSNPEGSYPQTIGDTGVGLPCF